MPGPELGIKLYADTGELASDLGRAAQISEREFAKMVAAGTAVGQLIAQGIKKGAESLKDFVLESIHTRAALNDLAKITGDNVQFLDGLRRQFIVSSGSAEHLAGALEKLAKSLHTDEGRKAVEALGLSIENLRAMKPGEAFQAIAAAMAKFEDGAAKATIAQLLFGKGGANLLPVLADLAETGGALGRITAEQAEQAERAQRAWRSFDFALMDSKETIATALIPEITKLLEQMTEGIKIAGGLVAAIRLFGANIDPGLSIVENIRIKEQELRSWNESGPIGHFFKKPLGASYAGTAGEIRKQIEFLKFMQRQEALQLGGPGSLDARDLMLQNRRPALVAPVTGRGADTEMRTYIAALQNLEKQYAHLTHEGAVAITMWETEKGSLRELTPEHKKELIAKAALIDAYRRDIDLRAMVIQGIEAQTKAEEKARAIAYDRIVQDKEDLDQMAFERSLIGASAREQEKLNAVRKIELQLRKDVAALPMDEEGNFIGNAGEQLAALREQAERAKKAVVDGITERQAAERDWLHGANKGFSDYVEMVADKSRQVQSLLANAFQHAEDALVEFVRTGKLSFKSLADSILSDLARIAIRQGITGPLAETFGASVSAGIAGAFGSLFGGGFAKGTDYVPRDMLALVHKGERIVPADENRRAGEAARSIGAVSRAPALAQPAMPAIGRTPFPAISAAPAIRIPSYAVGTPYVPRTGLAMLHQGERVVPAAENAGWGAPPLVININAPGADRAGLQRVEATIERLAGSLRHIAVDAVRSHLAARGVGMP